MIDDFVALSRDIDYDVIAGIDALGFILAAALAVKADKPFIPIRKGGKLPVEVDCVTFVDYSGTEKSLEIRQDAFTEINRVLIVDEWVETGSQIRAAITLIEQQGARVVGIATIKIDDNDATNALRERYPVLALANGL